VNSSIPPVDALLEAAVGEFNAGRAAHARRLCEQAVATFAAHPGVLQLLATLCRHDGDMPGARRHVQASLALRPDHPPTLLLAGDLACQQGDWARALAFHGRAVELLPDRPQAAFALAKTQHAAGHPLAARHTLKLAAITTFGGVVIANRTVTLKAPGRHS